MLSCKTSRVLFISICFLALNASSKSAFALPAEVEMEAKEGCCFIKQFEGTCQGITEDKDGECKGPYKKGIGSCGNFESFADCKEGMNRPCLGHGGCTKNHPYIGNGDTCTCGIAWSFHSDGECKEITIPGYQKAPRCVKKGTITPIPIPRSSTGMTAEESAEFMDAEEVPTEGGY